MFLYLHFLWTKIVLVNQITHGYRNIQLKMLLIYCLHFSDVMEFADEQYFVLEGQMLSLTVVRNGAKLGAGNAGIS